ncbi:hypothetical protein OQA88_12812 [Cercophora sp. LCS_1]
MAATEETVSMLSGTRDGSGTRNGSEFVDNGPRFVLCIDYGTTYTGAAWILTEGRIPTLSDIKVVKQWGSGVGGKVPSVFTYSPGSGQKWGYGVGKNGYRIRYNKLKLQSPTRLDALKSMKHMLTEAPAFLGDDVPRQAVPRHLIKTSADIATDYLGEVMYQVRLDIGNDRDQAMLGQFPFDVVITHPAEWDERARNLTFRAVNTALRNAFHDVVLKPGYFRLTTEPEACAQSTVRAAQAAGMVSTHQLRAGECFIVIDAGGGTVDVVSYRIVRIAPAFKLERITVAESGHYGATKIDDYFICHVLPTRLSPESYRRLLRMGRGDTRYGRANHTMYRPGEELMIERFEPIKHGFAGRGPPGQGETRMVLDLPQELGEKNDSARGIENGQLLLSCDDMEAMFYGCVKGIEELAEKQLTQIQRKGLTARSVFLSGGFSQNEYLFKCVTNLARSRGCEVLRGEKEASWTAVAQGGVLMGLGVGCEVPPAVRACPYSLGVVIAKEFALYDHAVGQRYTDSLDRADRATGQIEWVVFKGDVVGAEPTEKTVRIIRKFRQLGRRPDRLLITVSDGDEQRGFNPRRDVRHEVPIDFDLGNIPPDVQRRVVKSMTNQEAKKGYQSVELQLEICVDRDGANIDLLCEQIKDANGRVARGGVRLGGCKIPFPGAEVD